MRMLLRTCLVLFACISAPFHSGAQSVPSQNSSGTVSVRELSIPPRALHAFEEGLKCLDKKDPAASLPHFRQAILEYEGYYEAFDRIGAAELKLSHLPEAEQAFRKAIEVSGGQFAHPLLALGAILDGREEFAEAESVTRKGLDLEPKSWTGHYYLGLAQLGLNRLTEAAASLHESLRWNANFPQAYLMLAEIDSRERNFSSLLSDADAYLRLQPDGPSSERVKALREFAEGKLVTLEADPDPIASRR